MNFDDIFAEVAGRSGGLEPLLNHFFGFLHRRTDFYVEYDKTIVSKAAMGFPIGVAEKMLLSAFHKFGMRQENSLPVVEITSDSAGTASLKSTTNPALSSTKPLKPVEEFQIESSISVALAEAHAPGVKRMTNNGEMDATLPFVEYQVVTEYAFLNCTIH